MTFNLNMFDSLEREVKDQVGAEIKVFAINTTGDAKLNAAGTIDEGTRRNLIHYKYANGTAWIYSSAIYAAYLEFGTGVFAAAYVGRLPVELQSYAMTFFVTGKGRLPSHPYLFPAYFKNLAILKERLKILLK